MLGFAVQKGYMPIGLEAIEQAIRLNGQAVKMNLDAFLWGRRTAHAQERQQLLLREMNHRVKNLFAVTSSIINLNARSAASVADLATSVTNRLNALSQAHSLTMVVNEAAETSVESGVTLHSLAEAILFPYDQGARSRLSIIGDDVAIAAKSITPLALLLHEFATNAAKYGSLSNEDGRVDITCTLDDRTVEIVWRETHESRKAASALSALRKASGAFSYGRLSMPL